MTGVAAVAVALMSWFASPTKAPKTGTIPTNVNSVVWEDQDSGQSPDDLEAKAALKDLAARLSMDIKPEERERALLERSHWLAELGRYPEAIDVARSLVETGSDAILEEALARYYILCRDAEVSESHRVDWEGRLQADPENPRLLNVLAALYEFSQMAEREIAVRERLDRVAGTRENLARLYQIHEESGDAAASAGVLERLAARDPENAKAYLVQKAEAEARAGDAEAARKTCGRLLAAGPADIGTLLEVGRVRRDVGDYDQAIAAFEECRKLGRDSLVEERCLFELAFTRFKAGRFADSDLENLNRLTNSASLSIQSSAATLLDLAAQEKEKNP